MSSTSGPSRSADRFVRALRAGEPRAVEAADRLLGTMARTNLPTELSPRQVEVLQMVAAGFSDGEIGLRLGISTYTAREHVRRAKSALGARTRAHAIALWVLREVRPHG